MVPSRSIRVYPWRRCSSKELYFDVGTAYCGRAPNHSASEVSVLRPYLVVHLVGSLALTLVGCNDHGSFDIASLVPIADAGPDQTSDVVAGDVVILDGSASSDPNGNPLTYSWSLTTVPGGSAAELSDTAAVDPSFAADEPGTYTASLVVNDGFFDSPADEVSIVVAVPAPNVTITSPTDLSLVTSTPVTVTGTIDDPGASVTVNEMVVANTSGSYTGQVALQEGSNTVTVVGENDTGVGSASIEVILNQSENPVLTIRSPRSGFLVGEELSIGEPIQPVQVSVTGGIKVNTTGIFLANQPTVTVNGVPADVQLDALFFSGCGLFNPFQCWRFAAVIPLDTGQRTIEAVGTDILDRSGTTSIEGTVDTCRIVWTAGGEPPGWAGETPEVVALAGRNHELQRNRCHEIDGCSIPGAGQLDDDPLPLALCNVAPTEFGRGQAPPVEFFIHGLESAFHRPCNRHDVCYQTCVPAAGSSGPDREAALREAMHACNHQQYQDTLDVCRRAYPTPICPPTMSVGCLLAGGCLLYLDEMRRCFNRASFYLAGVELAGFTKFQERQEHYCAE